MSADLNKIIGNTKKQFVTFNIGDYYLGIDILDVREINTDFKLTPVYHSHKSISGCLNLRGQIFVIIDLSVSLNLKQTIATNKKLIILKESAGPSFGIIVDEISDIEAVHSDLIEEYQYDNDSIEIRIDEVKITGLIEGVCKLENKLMLIINAKNILNILN